MNNELINQQQIICTKYGAKFTPSIPGWKVGIAKNIDSGQMPINGLRHKVENGTLGWYIWAGNNTDDPGFFEPMHIEHVEEMYPQLSKYLGLPSGWRFQFDDNGYEDVWEDKQLLNI